MLLFRRDVLPEVAKPISEIAIGESFTVTVTESDWTSSDFHGSDCAIDNAIAREHDIGFGDVAAAWNGVEFANIDGYFTHDARSIVDAYDNGDPFPGETPITFTRRF